MALASTVVFGEMRVTQLVRQLMSNMTVRLSWGLVLATFSLLVLIACGIGLYALHHGATIVQSAATHKSSSWPLLPLPPASAGY
jgi:methyl-accepting chemotaxis protein-2 (aspartate sensor receptor)